MDNKFTPTLCVVDDSKDILMVLKEPLEAMGYKVLTFESANDALEALNDHHTSTVLIISDVVMPTMDGYAFRGEVLKKYPGIPFVLMSGLITQEEALRAVELQVSGFIDKTQNFEGIKTTVERCSSARLAQINEKLILEQTFLSEAMESIADLEGLILALEGAPGDTDTLNAIFRLVHTIKGSSGVLESRTITTFTHHFEDLLSTLKKESRAATTKEVSLMLRSFDTLKQLLQRAERGDYGALSGDELWEKTQREVNSAKDAAPKSPSTGKPGDANGAPLQSARDGVRVGTQTLDEFMELSGEITVIRNMVNKLVRSIEKQHPGNKDVGLLAELLEEMHKVNSSMQSKITELRKVPLSNIYRPIPRAVRDICRATGKEIELETIGAELRVDTVISQALTDSLMHIVRNASDHGIETPTDRKTRGKTPEGKIRLSAKEERDEIIVEISDNGRGIDPKKIRKKLVENGTMSAADADKIPDAQVIQRIFDPGFSTAEKITDISGRGVGMDMVKTCVDKLGGKIEIQSELHKGTTFCLKLPTPKSVLIINALITLVGKQTFAIPQDKVLRLIQVPLNEKRKWVLEITGGEVLQYEGRLIPIVSLARVLLLETSETDKLDLSLVLLKSEGFEFALVVDHILDNEEIVVKNVGPHLDQLKAYSGVTFLGDGSVGLILDVSGIAALSSIESKSNEIAKLQSQEVRKSRNDDFLLVKLNLEGTYAISINDVYRIELISKESLVLSCGRWVLSFRDHLIPLTMIDAGYVGVPFKPNDQNEYTVLVIQRHHHFVGLVVNSVLDIGQADEPMEKADWAPKLLKGTLFFGEQAASVVDVEAAFSEEKEEESNVIPLAPQPKEALKAVSGGSENGWGVF